MSIIINHYYHYAKEIYSGINLTYSEVYDMVAKKKFLVRYSFN